MIKRQDAIDEIDEWIKAFRENGHKESAADACLIQDGIRSLPSAQPEQRWIPVMERLPEWGGWFIVSITITEEEDKWVGLRLYSQVHGWEWGEQPDAWMPLPSPYQVESEDK